jgi:hypothetical protein
MPAAQEARFLRWSVLLGIAPTDMATSLFSADAPLA